MKEWRISMKGLRNITAALGLVLAAAVALPAQAAGYPNKPIQVVVPYGAGGDTDLNCRIMSKYLEKEFGKPVVIVNINGAGGSLGSRKIKDSAPDGYNVLFFQPSMFLNKIMGLVDYSFGDFEVAGMAVMDRTSIFVVNANSPYKSLQDLIAAAKEKPRKIKIATETGALSHIQILAFEKETGTSLNVVDVGSAAQKIVALLGKQIDVIAINYGIIKDYVASGKFRAIGVMDEQTNAFIPSVKTFKEQGVNLAFPKYFFYLFPKGTPKDIVAKFSAALQKACANPQAQAELNKFMVSAQYLNPEDTVKYLKEQEVFYMNYKEMLSGAKVQKEEVKKE